MAGVLTAKVSGRGNNTLHAWCWQRSMCISVGGNSQRRLPGGGRTHLRTSSTGMAFCSLQWPVHPITVPLRLQHSLQGRQGGGCLRGTSSQWYPFWYHKRLVPSSPPSPAQSSSHCCLSASPDNSGMGRKFLASSPDLGLAHFVDIS